MMVSKKDRLGSYGLQGYWYKLRLRKKQLRYRYTGSEIIYQIMHARLKKCGQPAKCTCTNGAEIMFKFHTAQTENEEVMNWAIR